MSIQTLLAVLSLGLCTGSAQSMPVTTLVRGEIGNYSGYEGLGLTVSLYDPETHRQAGSALVRSDGSFQVRDVPVGLYVLRVEVQPGSPIAEQRMDVRQFANDLMVRLPELQPHYRPGKVSVTELQHPLSSKGAKLLRQAQTDLAAGNQTAAIEGFQRAIAERSAAPYAHGILGTEYLKQGRLADATRELEECVRLLPRDAKSHSNLGYALYQAGKYADAEAEARRAIELDHDGPHAHLILGAILLHQGSHEAEALEHLRFASATLPSAKRLLEEHRASAK